MEDNIFIKNIAAPEYTLREVITQLPEYRDQKAAQELGVNSEGAGRRLQEEGELEEVEKEEQEDDFDGAVGFYRSEVYSKYKNVDAGAIYFTCADYEDRDCNVKMYRNHFERNVSADKGGALRWVNTRFNTETEDSADTNTYKNNEADYGAIQASYPTEILYTMKWEGRPEEAVDSVNQIIDIAPGQSFNLVLTILDADKRIYKNENNAIAAIDFTDPENVDSSSVIIGRDTVAKDGRFNFTDLLIRIEPASSAQVEITFQDLDVFGNRISFIDNAPTFSINARACIKGEFYTTDLSCIKCPPTFYLYEE